MPSVALVRPLWWVACRSLRLMTGLAAVVLAMALGANARSAPTEAAATADRPAATAYAAVAVSWRPDSAPAGEVRGAERPTGLATAGPGVTGTVASGQSGSMVEAGPVAPPAPSVGSRPAASAAGSSRSDPHAWAFGQRSPPRQ